MMSSNDRNPKKLKGILSFFKKKPDEPSIGVHCGSSSFGHSTCERVISQSLESQGFESQREDHGQGQGFDTSTLERDPGLRCQISEYPINERDNIRRAYMILGPYQPKLKVYPSHVDGAQSRRF